MNNHIKKSTYEGYLWLSDQKKPTIINQEKIEIFFSDGKVNVILNGFSIKNGQFILEGQLYDLDNAISYSIKFADGKYIVSETTVDPLDYNRENIRIVNYLGNHMPYLQFLQYWKPEVDDLCEGMETLVPEKLVFVGFINNKED